MPALSKLPCGNGGGSGGDADFQLGDAIYKNESCEAELHFACPIQGKHLIIESISDAEHDAWDCKTLIE